MNIVFSENALKCIIDSRELLKDKKSWTKFTRARNEKGLPTENYNIDAVKWCLTGALAKVAISKTDYAIASFFMEQILCGPTLGCLALWNDNPVRNHTQILEALDQCIKRGKTFVGKNISEL